MSKKSRKRNKKILAAIGRPGLGAAALASRKKQNLVLKQTKDGKDPIPAKRQVQAILKN